jgi:hypothetical protein
MTGHEYESVTQMRQYVPGAIADPQLLSALII